MKMSRLVIFCISIAVISGCSTTGSIPPVSQPDVLADLDNAILQSEALLEDSDNAVSVEIPGELTNSLLNLDQALSSEDERFDVLADKVEAQQFFRDLDSAANINILASPDIQGEINLSLKDVTLIETLTAIRDIYGYDFQLSSYGYRILSNRITTRIFNLNYLNVIRSGTSGTGISGSQISSAGSQSSQVDTSYTSDFWSDLQELISSFLKDEPGRQVVVNPQTGVIVVRATPEELNAVEEFLGNAEESLQKQVIIEARILEVNLQDGFQSGINWDALTSELPLSLNSNVSLTGNALNGVPDVGGIFNLGVNNGDFSTIVELLGTQGEVRVLSSPRISTVNNQKAVIKVGTDEYFVTDVSGGNNNDDVDSSPDIKLTPFFSGIALDVTPQIGKDNNIILHVRPSVTDISEKTKVINIDGKAFQLPLATSRIREADSIIRATDGQIVIIGGLLQNTGDSQSAGIPGTGGIPGLRWLTNQQRRENNRSELIILLQPKITSAKLWQEELVKARNRMGN